MEDHEEKRIVKNLHKLIENTICSTAFIQEFSSRGILSSEDLENLKIEGNNRGRFAQAAKFYSLLSTRANSFNILIDALTLTNQSEVLNYLHPTDTRDVKHQAIKYKLPPKHIDEFLLSDLKLLLLVSKDCQISGERILQTVPNTHLVTIDDLLTHEKITHCSNVSQYLSVITCDQNLDRALYYISESPEKVILITNKNVDIDYIKQSPFANKLQTDKIKVTEDNISWEDLSDEFQSKILATLEKYMNVDKTNINLVIQNIDIETLLVLIKGEVPILLKNTIPKPLSYYIERKLITRNRISDKLFDNPGDDIFLFTDIEPKTLEQKAKLGQVVKSEDLLSDAYEEDDENFVILQATEHFQQICDKFRDKAIHVLRYNQSNFIWIKSRGSLSKLHLALHTNQMELDEAEFMEQIFGSQIRTPICISDSPGMGKSVLLAQIARRLQASSEMYVAFVVINELVQYVKVRIRTENVDKAILQALLVYLRNNILGNVYLENHNNSLKEILFDGFDEIDADDIELGYKCLKVIRATFAEARIWVTARPHLLLDLENVLEVLGFKIVAFQENDQIKFLNLYWSHESSNIATKNKHKLPYFAKECLSTIKSFMREDQDIAGIPLQCLLIAEVYENDAISFISSDSTNLKTFSESLLKIQSLADLYQHFVSKKFNNFHIRYEKESVATTELSSAHIRFSIDHLFPSFQQSFQSDLKHPLSTQQIFDVGFLESQNIFSSSRFVHRTFAEYFVAIFVLDTLKKGCNEVTFDFITKNILDTRDAEFDHISSISASTYQFKSSVICYFVNTMLGNISSVFISFSNGLKKVYPTILQRTTEASAYSNLVNIFKHLLLPTCIQPKFKQNIFRPKFIFCTVSRSSRAFNKLVLHQLKTLHSSPLCELQFCNKTIMHIAVARGSFELVELLLKKENFDELLANKDSSLCYLFDSWINTCDTETQTSLNDKKQIIHLLESRGFFDGYVDISRNIDLIQLSLAQELTAVYTCKTAQEYKYEDRFVQALGEILESDPDRCPQLLKIIFNEQNVREPDFTAHAVESTNLNRLLDAIIYDQILKELEQLYIPSPKECHLLISFKNLRDMNELILNLNALPYHGDNNKIYVYRHDTSKTLFRILFKTDLISRSKQDILKITKCVFENASRVHIFKSFEETFTDVIEENVSPEMFNLANTFSLVDPILSVLLKMLYLSETQQHNQPPNLEIRDLNNETLLHFAASSATKNLLQYVLPLCLDINSVNKSDETALHQLAYSGDFAFENWKYLVDKGSNFIALDKHQQTPIANLSLQDTKTGLQAVIYVQNKLHLTNDKRIDFILFVVVSRLSFDVVKATCEWYKTFVMKPFENILVNINGKDATILDAAFLNYDGCVLEYVLNILKCTSHLCVPPTMSIHNCLSEQHLSENQMTAYINHLAEYFPHFVDVRNEDGCVPLCNFHITLETAKALLEKGANVNITDYEGNKPLHVTVRRNKSPEIISTLVKFGADINAENFNYETPLICATKFCVKEELPKLIQHLLKLGADARKRYENGNTILHLLPPEVDKRLFQEIVECFMYFGYKDVFETLNDDRNTPFDIAQKYFHLSKKYIDITKQKSRSNISLDSLLMASKFTNVKEIQNILKSGENPNVTDENMNTPLHNVTQNVFSLECWKILLENNSDPFALNINDKTPICLLPYFDFTISTEAILFVLKTLMKSNKIKLGDILALVVSTHAYETVKKVLDWYDENQGNLENIGPVNFKSKMVTLLDAALHSFDGDVVEFVMLKVKCNKLLQPPLFTVIHNCIQSSKSCFEQKRKYIELVGRLCPELLNNRNEKQLVPLSLEGIEHELVKPLVELGADINAQDENGNTPLHYALKHCMHYSYTPELVFALLKCGADVNAQNNLGETPIFYSVKFTARFEESLCVKYLVENGANVRQKYSSGNTVLHLLAAKLNKKVFHVMVDYFLSNSFKDLFSLRNEQFLTAIDVAKLHFELLPKTNEMLQRFQINV